MSKKDQASILYSGGSDSTLVAAMALKQMEKVHLLTFAHSGQYQMDKSKINARRLQKKFGKERVVHKIMNIEELFKLLHYGTYLSDLRRYKAYLANGLCHACQIAMHTTTIIYDLENNIRFARDGYKREKSHIYIFMAKEGMKITKKFYEEYGIDYDSPVYDIARTDRKLFDMGITSEKDVKFPHERIVFSTQPYCPHGILQNAYLLGYHRNLYRHLDKQPPGINYHIEKIAVAKKYIERYFSK